MRNPLRNAAVFAAIATALGLGATGAHAQLLFNGSTLTENFDSLAQTGTANTFTDNSTIPGFYAINLGGTNVTNDYRASTGTDNAGDLYSYGVAGVNPVTDRALGSLASGTSGTIYTGVQIRNNTASAINSFSLSYFGEQWRDGGNTAVSNALTFAYSVRAASTGEANLTSGTFTTLAALTFTAPQNGATATLLDGNLGANRVFISGGVLSGLNWQPGQDLWLRWEDLDDAGADDGLAIDNLTFSVATTSVPEAGTLALAGLGVLPLAAVAVRRRKAA